MARRRGPSGATTRGSRKSTRPGYEQIAVSQRKPGVSKGARCIAQGGAEACRSRESRGGKATNAASRGRAQGGLRLPVGQRREGGKAREVLRAIRRQEHAAALLV